MSDPLKRDVHSKSFTFDSNFTESTRLNCRTCGSKLDLHQPDPEMTDRILGTCARCKTWYLFDDNHEGIEIASGGIN